MVENNNNYNEDELHPPEWINKEFLLTVLKNVESGVQVEVENFTVTPGSSKSDHYASIMFRVKVTYRLSEKNENAKQISLIVKAMPESEGMKKELLGDLTLFETEIKMYQEILPKMEAMLRAVGDNTRLGASCFYHSLEPHKCLVFEDLVVQGYTTIAHRSPRIEEVKQALMKLAKIHATSYKLAEEGDVSISGMENHTFTEEVLEKFDLLRDGVKNFKDAILKHDDLIAYVPEVERIEKGLLKRTLRYFNEPTVRENGKILVLNHGDFHMKNMLVKANNAGKLDDLMLVDFQICWYGSQVIDLLYASVMLFSPEMRANQRQELFYYYFKTFQQVLRTLNFQGHIPTMLEFQRELFNHKPWELFLNLSFLTINHLFVVDGDVQKFCEDADYRRNVYENPDVIRDIRAMLPRLLHEGYFESLD